MCSNGLVPADIDLYLQEVIINTSHIQKFANISRLLHLLTLGSNMTLQVGGVVFSLERKS
jgi:nitric oxide synthase oxygenase domain/subunit